MVEPPRNAEFVSEDEDPIREERITVGRDDMSGQYEPPAVSRGRGWGAMVQRIWIGRDKLGRFRSLRKSPPAEEKKSDDWRSIR